MSKIEQIKAEIERLYEKYRDAFYQHKDDYHLGLYDGLDMAKRVINSLPKEQHSEDLEAAVEGIIVGFPSRNDIKMQADEFSKATANFKDGDKVKIIIVKED